MKGTIRLAVLALALPAVASAGSLAGLKVYPNPVRASQGETTVTFAGLTGGTVEIFNAHGVQVRKVSVPDGATDFVWDLKNEDGRDVASGIYLWRAKVDGDHKTGKLGVIR